MLTNRFSDASDIDVLVEFLPEERVGFFRLADIEEQLSHLLGGRKVDVRTPMDLSRHLRKSSEVRSFSMLSPDAVRLRHMRQAASMALEIATGHNREDLSTNALAMALTRCLEILGEAASKICAEVRARFPDLPFPTMVSMRNRLIDANFDID